MPGMAGMPGMMSAEQMTNLTGLSGKAFDQVWLQMMIDHHSGAIDMSATELRDGTNGCQEAGPGHHRQSAGGDHPNAGHARELTLGDRRGVLGGQPSAEHLRPVSSSLTTAPMGGRN